MLINIRVEIKAELLDAMWSFYLKYIERRSGPLRGERLIKGWRLKRNSGTLGADYKGK